MEKPPFVVPDPITFEQAIALTQNWLQQLDHQNLSDQDSEAIVAALVATENGARGFFVTYLTDERSLADHPSPGILNALRSAPKLVADLMIKNLAMSTAMEIAHRRRKQVDMAQGSQRVRSRMMQLLELIHLPEIQLLAQTLVASAATHEGTYEPFLSRWGYDAEQRLAIQKVFQTLLSRSEQAPEKN